MRLRIVFPLIALALLFTFCKKKKTTVEETPDPTPSSPTATITPPVPGTQIVKIYDQDISSSGFHDNGTFFYYYDSNYRLNLVKEYDTTSTPAYVVTKINYKEATYTYNSFNKVTVETITTYSPSTSVQTNNYYYDALQRMVKKVTYFDNIYYDSTRFTYGTNKIISKYGISNIDTLFLNNLSQNLDSVKYGPGGQVYKYMNDGKPNPFKDRDYALSAYGVNPYKCDFNTRKIKTPFGVFNFAYTYNANTYPAFYTTILGSGSGCNVTFYYN